MLEFLYEDDDLFVLAIVGSLSAVSKMEGAGGEGPGQTTSTS